MDIATDLVAETRRLLYLRIGEWPRICAETDIPYSWLTKFAQADIENPGATRLLALYRYLTQQVAA